MYTNIIPQIKEIKVLSAPISLKDFTLTDKIRQELSIADEIFKDNAIGYGKNPISFINDESLKDEQYKISAQKDGIVISAKTTRALMYALYTLSELDIINDGNLCEFELSDEPSLDFRAMSDDISRGQVSTFENFCDIIRRLARYKYNTYMPYIEDIFRFRSIPEWGMYSGGLYKEEWQAIIEFAKRYYVDVRPIINILGHFDKGCRVAALQPLALKYEDGRTSDVMDPRNPKVREVIKLMLDEIVDCFGEGIIHCGGDEPGPLTEICGKEEGGSLFIDHFTFVEKELEKRNCTFMMYADFFAAPWGDYSVPLDRVKEMPKSTNFVFWDYGVKDDYPFIDALHKTGINLFISPGSHTWNRLSCDIHTCFENTKGLLKTDAGRSLGMIMSCWADGGDTLRELFWPGVLVGANFCWSPLSDYSYKVFYNVFHKSFYGFNEDEAALLENVYHQDRVISREHQHEFKAELWSDPSVPVKFTDKADIAILQAALKKATADYNGLVPKRNFNAFNALEWTIEASKFTADKIASLPHKKPETREEAASYQKAALELAARILELKELHKKLWFDCNRASEWEMCASRYDDMHDRLMIFARNATQRRMFSYWG